MFEIITKEVSECRKVLDAVLFKFLCSGTINPKTPAFRIWEDVVSEDNRKILSGLKSSDLQDYYFFR